MIAFITGNLYLYIIYTDSFFPQPPTLSLNPLKRIEGKIRIYCLKAFFYNSVKPLRQFCCFSI